MNSGVIPVQPRFLQLLGSSDWLLPVLLAQCILIFAWLVLFLRARTWRPFILHAVLCVASLVVLYVGVQHTVAVLLASCDPGHPLHFAGRELVRLSGGRAGVGCLAGGLCVAILLVLDAVAIAHKPDSPPQGAQAEGL